MTLSDFVMISCKSLVIQTRNAGTEGTVPSFPKKLVAADWRN